MDTKPAVLIVCEQTQEVDRLRESQPDFDLQHAYSIHDMAPPDDLAFVLVDYAILDGIPNLPAWRERTPVIVYNAPRPGTPRRFPHCLAGALGVESQSLVELDLPAWQTIIQLRHSPQVGASLDQVLSRIDEFSRRILATNNPALLKRRLPALLSTLVFFHGMALWDWSSNELEVHLPADWSPEHNDRVVAHVRELLAAREAQRSLPENASLVAFQTAGEPISQADIHHHITANVGSGDGLLCVFRTGGNPFSAIERQMLVLAANLVAYALRNARLFEGLEAQARKIIEKNRELAKASRLKSNFLANTSHELKTPLHSILGLAELLPEADSAAELQQMTERIGVNARRLLDLVTDILDFSRLLVDEETIYVDQFDLDEFLRELADGFIDVARVKGVALRWSNEVPAKTFPTDREKLFRIAANLLSNAFKFTVQGEVELRFSALNGDLLVTVKDTGVGIPEEELARIFEQFHRVKGPLQDAAEGAGLGLAIAHRLTRVLGGEIRVTSAVGRGSVFTLQVPPCRSDASPESNAAFQQEKGTV
ncbi:MAG: HAMP domain-containing sensor histidine kinase [Candidatus Lernaella stagnicola]|nr:HAMP domain-containing sensor histidine kinase [Candidatus Lernaella stagnicola]